jgi:hypothetical protein
MSNSRKAGSPTPDPKPPARPGSLALDYITLDNQLQSRALKANVVSEYASVIRRGGELPPVLVVRDANDNYYLVDGHHRVAATRELTGIDDIAVEIIDGTFNDALWLSWGANRDHGLRRTQKDKRRAIHAALKHPLWKKKSSRAIAKHIGCDHKTVAAMRQKLARGEFPTNKTAQGPPRGPSKRDILKACQLLAKVQPEQARQFRRTRASNREGWLRTHAPSLVWGQHSQARKTKGCRERVKGGMNVNNTQR